MDTERNLVLVRIFYRIIIHGMERVYFALIDIRKALIYVDENRFGNHQIHQMELVYRMRMKMDQGRIHKAYSLIEKMNSMHQMKPVMCRIARKRCKKPRMGFIDLGV